VALAHDGKLLLSLTGCGDSQTSPTGYAQLWDVAAAKPIGDRLAHHGPVLAVALSHDGRMLLTGCGVDQIKTAPGYAELWDIEIPPAEGQRSETAAKMTRRCRLPHSDDVVAAAFTADDRQIVTASEKKTRVWDVRECTPTGHPSAAERSFGARVGALALEIPDCQLVALNDHTHAAFLAQWRAESQRPRGPPFKHNDEVSAVTFGPDAGMVVTGSWDKTTCFWNAKTGKERKLFCVGSEVYAVAARRTAGGRDLVLIGCGDGTVKLWNFASDTLPSDSLELAHPNAKRINAVALGARGSQILALAGSSDKTMRLWNATTGQPVAGPWECSGEILAVALSADGQSAVAGCQGGDISIWNVETGQMRWTQKNVNNSNVWALALSADGRYLATSTYLATGTSVDRAVRLLDPATGRLFADSDPLQHDSPVWGIAFTRDGRTLLTGCGHPLEKHGYAQFWDRRTCEPLGKAFAQTDRVNAVALRGDGKLALIGSADFQATLWEVPQPFPADRRAFEAWFSIRLGLTLDDRGVFRFQTVDEFWDCWKILETAGYPWSLDESPLRDP
jgi:WD40 repeat protein